MNDIESFFVNSILVWYQSNKRDFPWRSRGTTPYQVLVAELMLKKTRAGNVVEVYEKFIRKYPTPADVATASKDELIDLMKPLGLVNQRVRAFQEIFKEIVEKYGGGIPDSQKDLLELPYIGKYTANAVLCFGYCETVPLVDVNITRVCSRFFGLEVYGDPRVDKHIWEFLEGILPEYSSREFNFALLDFASVVCTSQSPKCEICVLKNNCKKFNN